MTETLSAALRNLLAADAGGLDSLLASAFILTGLAVLTAIPTAMMATRKGRSRGFWLLFALSIPLLPLLLICLLPARPGVSAQGKPE